MVEQWINGSSNSIWAKILKSVVIKWGGVNYSGECYEARLTNSGTYIGTYWCVKTAVPGVPGFCNSCKAYKSNRKRESSPLPSSSTSKLIGLNSSTGYSQQESNTILGIGYYVKTASYAYNNYNDAKVQISSFNDCFNPLASSVSLSTSIGFATWGLDNLSSSIGIKWDDNFYSIESSFSILDLGAFRLGFNTVKDCGNGIFNENGVGIEISAINVALAVLAPAFAGGLIPAY